MARMRGGTGRDAFTNAIFLAQARLAGSAFVGGRPKLRYSTIGITGYAPLHHDGIIYSTPLRDPRFVDSLLEGNGFERSVPRKPRLHSATHFLIMKSLSAADSPPIELTEEDRPGETKPGEDSHWHIFHIIDRRMV